VDVMPPRTGLVMLLGLLLLGGLLGGGAYAWQEIRARDADRHGRQGATRAARRMRALAWRRRATSRVIPVTT